MTNYLGPLTPEHFHIFENDETKRDGTESINLICSVEQAHQILGLCDESIKNSYGALRVITSKNSRWGIIPVQTNDNMKVNEHLSHSGLYQLLDMEYETMGNRPDIVKVHITAEMLSKRVDEILSVLYSRGGEDGSDIKKDTAFVDETPVYDINEDGATFDTTNDWYAPATSAMTSGAIASSGGEIVFSGQATTDGVYGQVWTCHRTQFSHNFIMEFTVNPKTKPATSSHIKNINIWFSAVKASTPPIWNNSVVVSVGANSTDVDYQINTVGAPDGATWRNMVPKTIDNVATLFKFRITTESTYNVKIELKRYVSGAWEEGWSEIFHGPTNIDGWTDLYFGACFNNMDSTTNSMSIDTIQVYENVEVDFPNVVVAPPGAVCNLTPDFTRASEDGNIQCFEDIVEDLNYQIDPDDFYDGSVKAWNSNYTDTTARLVTHNEVDLDPTKFHFGNGIVKLVTKADGVEFYYWNGSSYTLLETFTLPNDILLTRPFLVSPNVFTLQLDRTFWTIRAGKPGIEIQHPSTPIGYTLHTCYEHDGATTTSPAADADISMLTHFYTKIWNKGTGTCASPNPAQRYRMMIIRNYQTTIKSDSIPATSLGDDEKTGIVFYDSNISDTADEGSLFRAREWFRPTRQVLALQGV